jgi:hypothetical protein
MNDHTLIAGDFNARDEFTFIPTILAGTQYDTTL